MRIEELFDPTAFETVERAVQEAERNTSGEIVPMVVSRSDAYPGVRAVAAAILAFAAGIVALSLPLDLFVWLPAAEIATFAAGYWLAGRSAVLRFLIPARVRAERVDRAAKLAFLEEGLSETRDRTGILLYVSLLEHRAEVLADRGINERVEDGTWDGVVRLILDGIRERRAEEGLVDAVRLCGEILASQFPPRPDDIDELSNRLRT